VMMNPPFALKGSDEKEFKFVDYALGQMQSGGLLFSVLPYAAMVKQGAYRQWRETLLENHTVLAVITFPEDLFYPIGVHTLGLFAMSGTAHPRSQNVLWVRALHDGLLKSKGKRLPHAKATNDFDDIRNSVKAFLLNPEHTVSNVNRFQKACPINLTDPLLELVPENYLDQASPTMEEIGEEIHQVMKDTLAYLVQRRTHNGS